MQEIFLSRFSYLHILMRSGYCSTQKTKGLNIFPFSSNFVAHPSPSTVAHQHVYPETKHLIHISTFVMIYFTIPTQTYQDKTWFVINILIMKCFTITIQTCWEKNHIGMFMLKSTYMQYEIYYNQNTNMWR